MLLLTGVHCTRYFIENDSDFRELDHDELEDLIQYTTIRLFSQEYGKYLDMKKSKSLITLKVADISFKMDLENPRTATALHFIALEYRSGAHIEYDPLQARVYFELAAKMGHAGACCDLALAYIKEDEEMKIKQDISKALEYITKGQESLV